MYAPVITGIYGKTLHMIDKKILQLHHIGGVILFSHNVASKEQLTSLITQIQDIRCQHHLPPALILIDHEGGSVQRLMEPDFTALPSAGFIGQLYQKDPQQALQLMRHCAQVSAYELHSVGINVCLAPVLDLLKPNTKEEHSRFFSKNPQDVALLTAAYIAVMQEHGILSVAKHFPGIGHSKTNTHYQVSLSEAKLIALLDQDLQPYMSLQQDKLLPAIMTAHRVYIHIDKKPVCISAKWMNDILRQQLNYQGLTFTDCVQMGGASIMGGNLHDKIHNSLRAGCDFVLSSQTPFGSYIELYNTLTAPDFDALMARQSTRFARVSTVFEQYHAKENTADFFQKDYEQAKQCILDMRHEEQKSVMINSRLPLFYQFKKTLIRNQHLKKYLKNSALLHHLNLSQFRLRVLLYKIKNYFIK